MSGISESRLVRRAQDRIGSRCALAIRALVVGSLVVAFLGGCLQGPWDYTPSNTPIFKGIWSQTYVVADRPITDACFGPLIELDEKYTPAFAFYDSAEVSIAGRFSNGAQTHLLSPKLRSPNCFVGDTASRPVKGETYQLQARFVWDSAGTQTVTRLTAVATITDSFEIKRTAMAPSVAFIGGFGAGGTLFSLENLSKLPEGVRNQMQTEFAVEIEELQELVLANDTAALRLFFLGDGSNKEPRGTKMTARLIELLKGDQKAYQEGDSLFYISNPDLNTLTHAYTSLRGRGVKGVLITQRWDTTASRIINPFQTFFGFDPDTGSYYFPGDMHRLVVFPDAENVDRGFNILDSIGFVNTWFFTGKNRIYFYACDTNYSTYLLTNTPAGDNPEDNPKIKGYTNINGGIGFFAALAVDSFDIFIKGDPADEQFPLPVTRPWRCNEDGWFESRDCIDYYREYCAKEEWKPSTCRVDAIRACLEVDWSGDTLGGMCTTIGDSARQDTVVYGQGLRRFCIENNYPESVDGCAEVRRQCETAPGVNACKQALWKTCDLRDWALPACRNAQVTYCRDSKVKAPALCKNAEKLCQENPKPSSCL
jgi:hypothetical protein